MGRWLNTRGGDVGVVGGFEGSDSCKEKHSHETDWQGEEDRGGGMYRRQVGTFAVRGTGLAVGLCVRRRNEASGAGAGSAGHRWVHIR